MEHHLVQVELRTHTTHTLTWLDAALKPKPGMVLVCKDDPRPWTVVHAYNITAQERNTDHEDWKVGSLNGGIDLSSLGRVERGMRSSHTLVEPSEADYQ